MVVHGSSWEAASEGLRPLLAMPMAFNNSLDGDGGGDGEREGEGEFNYGRVRTLIVGGRATTQKWEAMINEVPHDNQTFTRL